MNSPCRFAITIGFKQKWSINPVVVWVTVSKRKKTAILVLDEQKVDELHSKHRLVCTAINMLRICVTCDKHQLGLLGTTVVILHILVNTTLQSLLSDLTSKI